MQREGPAVQNLRACLLEASTPGFTASFADAPAGCAALLEEASCQMLSKSLSTPKRRRGFCLYQRQALRCLVNWQRPAIRNQVRRRWLDWHPVVVRRRPAMSGQVRRRRLHPDQGHVKNWKNSQRLVRNLLLRLRVLARRRRQGHWRRAARWQPLLPWEAAGQNGAHLQDELSLSK